MTTYSYRIHELLVRTCIEVEANFRAILCENAYRKKGNWTLTDYHKIEKSHFLSKYEVKLPTWRTKARRREPANGIREKAKIFTPFEKWAACHELSWYREYNAVKHDRHSSFKKANLENLLNAVSGLVALLSSQFYDECFSSSFGIATASSRIIQGGPRFMFGSHDGYDDAVGGYFKVKWPKNMPEEDRYDFDWQKLGPEQDPFDNFPYGC